MNHNQEKLMNRVCHASEVVLQKQGYVSPIDVLLGIGFLVPVHVENWRKGRIPYLERAIEANLKKITFAMKCFRKWAREKGLKESRTEYFRRTSGPKTPLRFSKSGDSGIEQAYRMHYVSPKLSEKKQKQLKEKLDKPPELVVYMLYKESQCSRCDKELHKGNFLIMEADQPLCLSCAKLDHLEFLPSGDAGLTRRAKKISSKYAIVVRFSQVRKRYERQGILVEKEAIDAAEKI